MSRYATEPIEPPLRYWTQSSEVSLAARLRVPWEVVMQDWPWEVAEPERLDEYLGLYDALTDDDERFTLMDVMLQAVEEQDSPLRLVQGWEELRQRIRQRPALHAWQMWYWRVWATATLTDAFFITPYTRELWWELYQPTTDSQAQL